MAKSSLSTENSYAMWLVGHDHSRQQLYSASNLTKFMPACQLSVDDGASILPLFLPAVGLSRPVSGGIPEMIGMLHQLRQSQHGATATKYSGSVIPSMATRAASRQTGDNGFIGDDENRPWTSASAPSVETRSAEGRQTPPLPTIFLPY